jgi:predicted secreted hydrolase
VFGDHQEIAPFVDTPYHGFLPYGADGSPNPYSQGAMIYPDGIIRCLKRDGFQVSVTRGWCSPHSGRVCPAGWTLQVLVEGLFLHTWPKMAGQELGEALIYWEGRWQ